MASDKKRHHRRKSRRTKDGTDGSAVFDAKVLGNSLGIGLLVVFALFLLFGRGSSSAGGSENYMQQQQLRGQEEQIIAPPRDGKFLYYFGYASDLLEDRVRKGSSKSAKSVDAGFVANTRFAYTIFSKVWKGGVADMVEKQGSETWGRIYKFPVKDIANLDKQKGIDNADPKYRKIEVDVETSSGRTYKAFTYVVVDDKRERDASSDSGYKEFPPSIQYRRCILKGAQESKLPSQYCDLLESIRDNGESFKRKSVGNACD